MLFSINEVCSRALHSLYPCSLGHENKSRYRNSPSRSHRTHVHVSLQLRVSSWHKLYRGIVYSARVHDITHARLRNTFPDILGTSSVLLAAYPRHEVYRLLGRCPHNSMCFFVPVDVCSNSPHSRFNYRGLFSAKPASPQNTRQPTYTYYSIMSQSRMVASRETLIHVLLTATWGSTHVSPLWAHQAVFTAFVLLHSVHPTC